MIRPAASLVLLAAMAAAAPRWVRLESDVFEVYATAPEPAARSLLDHLQQGRRVFGGLAASRGVPLPVRVFLFAGESEFLPYRPAEPVSGFYQSGPVRDIIALPYRGPESLRVAMHEFVHLVLSHAAPRLPRWFEEGTAEFYSTLRVGGDRLNLGGVIPAHLSALDRFGWLDAAALMRVDRDSPEYNLRGKVGVFYAQSWALVHMLNLAPGYRERMPRFLEGLLDGRLPEAAFQEAFGKPVESALGDLRAWVEARRFPMVELDAGARPFSYPVSVHEASAAEAAHALIDLAIRTGNLKDAEKTFRRLAREKPSPETEGRLGLLALKLGRDGEAMERFRRAIELGSRDAETHFEYAMLVRERRGARTEVRESLRRAVSLNPDYAEAHFILGLMDSQDQRVVDAMEHFKRAAAILPRQSQFWHALAMAAREAGDEAEARRAARRARAAASTPQEIEMADAALRLVDAPASPPRPPRPEVRTPPSWENPKGDRRIEGTLARIDCLGESARFVIAAGGREVSLFVGRPGEVLLRNLSTVTFEFRCGAQEGRAVAVDYVAKPDARLGTEGEITSIEFR